jgi:acetolactate synthase-1/2/3 large subunit
MHDATPMVVFVGQVPLRHRDRGVFQEVITARFSARW